MEKSLSGLLIILHFVNVILQIAICKYWVRMWKTWKHCSSLRGVVKVKLAEISWAACGCKQMSVVPHAASSTADWHVSITTGNPMFSETETRSRLMTVCVVRTGSACKIPLMILCFSLPRPRMVFSKLTYSILFLNRVVLVRK